MFSRNIGFASIAKRLNHQNSRAGQLQTFIVDPYVPPKSLMLFPTKHNREILWTRLKKFVASNYAAYNLRQSYKKMKMKFRLSKLALEAEEKYIDMINALNAAAELEKKSSDQLENIVTPGMRVELEGQVRKISEFGKLVWKSQQRLSRPRCVNLAVARAKTNLGVEEIAQATIMINVDQFIGFESKGSKQKSDNFHKNGPEYIVYEKWLHPSKASSPWKIAGKIKSENSN